MADERLRRRAANLAWRQLGDELVVIDLPTNRYHLLNPVGAAIWQRLGLGATVEALVEWLAQRFGAEAAAIRADVTRFIGELKERLLVEPAGAAELPGAVSPDAFMPGSYEQPSMVSEEAFYAAFGCGKVQPNTMACIQIQRQS